MNDSNSNRHSSEIQIHETYQTHRHLINNDHHEISDDHHELFINENIHNVPSLEPHSQPNQIQNIYHNINENEANTEPPPNIRRRLNTAAPDIPQPPSLPNTIEPSLQNSDPSHIEEKMEQKTDPKEKKKRIRVKESLLDYLLILERITIAFGSEVAAQFKWHDDGGVICMACDQNKNLYGYWTEDKIMKQFSWTKFVDHLKTRKHQKNCTKSQIESIKLYKSLYAAPPEILQREKLALQGLLNKIHHILYSVKYNYSLHHVPDLAEFMHDIGGNILVANYGNYADTRDIIRCLSDVQETADYKWAHSVAKYLGISIVLDGHKRYGQGIKMYIGRGLRPSHSEIEERFLYIIP